jgi:hypothetical protein
MTKYLRNFLNRILLNFYIKFHRLERHKIYTNELISTSSKLGIVIYYIKCRIHNLNYKFNKFKDNVYKLSINSILHSLFW